MFLSEFDNLFEKSRLIRNSSFKTLGKLNALFSDETLIFISESKYIRFLSNKISAVITTEEIYSQIQSEYPQIGILVVENPKNYFFEIHKYLYENNYYFKEFESLISYKAIISDKNTFISDINVKIGDNTIIEPNVVIHKNTEIGNNCVIRSGTIIGTEGFEVIEIDGINQVVPHGGKVIINDNVEIQANNTISKGLFPSRNTIIHEEVKTDNLVHIAHGAWIGKRAKIAASAMIAGSVTIGKNVWIGPSAVISSGINIGDNASITLGSVVTKNVAEGQKVSGNFAIEHSKFLNFLKSIR